ncbi:MAG TPA: hypothetical protein DD471_09315 [Planctomycetes bacterium]|nr:hypothetical protein [Planctomycetota bacterium]
MLMAGFCGAISYILYAFFFVPPSRTFSNLQTLTFRELTFWSYFNAGSTFLCWGVTLLACKHMVKKPLQDAGFTNFILTLHGSWPFIFLGGVFPSMMGLYASYLGTDHGITQKYPLFLLNLLSPAASVAALTFAFPPAGTLEKVLDIIAPEEPEPPEPPETGEQGQ